MRYYGETYLSELTSTVDRINMSVDMPSLSRPIDNVDVMDHRSQLKNSGVGAANSADKHISDILIKLVQLHSDLVTFYGQVDTLAEDIAKSATQIKRIILSSTTSLDTINSMLAGTGNYAGVDITADKIRNAVQDKQKYKIMLQDAWASVVDAGVTADDVKEKVAENYISYIKEKSENGKELSSDEYDRLKRMYGYYVGKRPHMMDGEDALKPNTMQNLIDVYEILDPKAKKAMDELFVNYIEDDEYTAEQLQRIKYITYTADPKYRDIIIYNSAGIVAEYVKGQGEYSKETKTIQLDFNDHNREEQDKLNTGSTEYSSFSVFFHEYGHALDDAFRLSSGELYSSHMIMPMYEELWDHIQNTIDSNGMTSVSDEQRYAVGGNILGYMNANVVPDGKSRDYYLPKKWTDDQVKLFNFLRDYYGYVEYDYCDDPKVVITEKTHFPEFEYEGDDMITISDIIGALTNNQIGGTNGAHSVTFDDTRGIKSPKQVKHAIEFDTTYWFDNKYATDRIGTEFIANCFNASVLGSDMKSARSVFGESCKEFDRFVDKIYSLVPDEYKNKGF